ncbi:hypothetical protein LEP1GSC193_2135 [Leptospira alstonii serovar Pingchang str. 80-412]|uniref:Uncharacterized protein n=2 Tax=Leptospira alstonii TaxID=28452 RepID=M6DC93_9LEPT|nr:hypothetical protein LEP1GSC194_0462 [Leptospira alstonii serovar Sichuan str. 79601]EQA79775.1 hypothetical protein LEP1GSC193_2135 [Leptospira alstonii serovar Pingchang str. 80-412]
MKSNSACQYQNFLICKNFPSFPAFETQRLDLDHNQPHKLKGILEEEGSKTHFSRG